MSTSTATVTTRSTANAANAVLHVSSAAAAVTLYVVATSPEIIVEGV